MAGFKMDDYVDVAERIREFSAKYPEGSLQSELVYMGDPAGWLCTARAYRSADDARPGVGHAFEVVPGKTQFTKDSECMNAETSAWGRAIVALGFDTKKITSSQEVRARHADESPAAPPAVAAPRVAPDDGGDPSQVVLTFGKHSGKRICEVPTGYLEWWTGQEQPKNPDAKRAWAAAQIHLKNVKEAA